MDRVDLQNPNDPLWYRKTAVSEYIADDRIWFWAMGTHWGQVVVFPPGTLQGHHKEMDSVPAMNPPGTLQVHFEFPPQFTSDDPSWDMHSTLTVFQVM